LLIFDVTTETKKKINKISDASFDTLSIYLNIAMYIQSFNNIHRFIFIAIATISSPWRRSARHFGTNLYYKIVV